MRSVNFYKNILGLPLKYETKEWTEFETGKTTLALHGGGRPNTNPGGREESLAGTSSIGFYVQDIEKAYRELKAKGVSFVMTPTDREGENIKLAVCLDPDGLPISIAEQTMRETRREAMVETSSR